MLTASIIICTHNRGQVVGRAIEAAVTEAASCGAEVLIVDNASTDDTPEVLAAFEHRGMLGVRVVSEERLGLSAARNRGLTAARGEVAAFLDDDAVPRSGWLGSLLAQYEAPGVACVGGPIFLRFESTPPPWLVPVFYPTLSAYYAGEVPCRLHHRPGNWFPTGANISFRTDRAQSVGGFSTIFGPLGRRPVLHDETDLCYRLERAGWEIRYAPEAAVDHWVLPERLQPAWFLARHWESGQSAAACALRNRGLLRALWGLRWYGPFLAVAPHVPREPIDSRRLLAECQRREALGYIRGLLRGIMQLRTLRRGMMRSMPTEPSLPAGAPAKRN